MSLLDKLVKHSYLSILPSHAFTFGFGFLPRRKKRCCTNLFDVTSLNYNEKYYSFLFVLSIDSLDLLLNKLKVVFQLLHLAVHLVDEAVALLA